MCAPDIPDPPDPHDTAAASNSTNISTAIANAFLGNVNQNTPQGSVSWDQSGTYSYTDPYTGDTYDIPRFTSTQTYSPEEQGIFDANQGARQNLANLAEGQSGRLNELLGTPFSLSGAPSAGKAGNYTQYSGGPSLTSQLGNAGAITNSIGAAGDITKTYGTDFSQDRQRVEDALFQRMEPSMAQDRQSLETQLANQGIRVGSDAYSAAQGDYGRNVNDARLGAILNAGQEQSRLVGLEANRAAFENSAQAQQYGQNANDAQFQNSAQAQQYGQNLSSAQFGNDARQQMYQNQYAATQGNNALASQAFNEQNALRSQYLNEQYAQRNQPINEITALLSGSQVSNPNFVNANMPTIPTTDVAGLINTNYNQRVAQAQGNNQNILGGLFGLGGSMLQGAGAAGGFGALFSDRRLKKDIEKVGETESGHNLYTYRYKAGGPMQLGLMAQEVEKKDPGAVIDTPSGYKMVDYDRVLELGA
ncbi:tail fiber domain-containing protein [Mesorhizobium sp. B2-5-9]|uniref:tail fiber domain-containing protein n=1 Tax=Mesorhizobium sp. B2-5-9 TaxID=2589921 RepID=UPI00112936A6|nr:tail fiber domain-containing protein [Mesorhizobium sp. B2-5-9]TPJ97630.1 tail fiber domain-containing protein [Mesorhizobium sp. B2-5-9]